VANEVTIPLLPCASIDDIAHLGYDSASISMTFGYDA